MFFNRKNKNILDSGDVAAQKKEKINLKSKKEILKKSDSAESNSNFKNTVRKPVKISFADFTKVPSYSKIVSNDPSSKFYIEDANLREDVIILEANYSIGGNTATPSIILIFSVEHKGRLNLTQMISFANEMGKTLIFDNKKDAKQFIYELEKSLSSNLATTDKNEVETGNRKKVIELFEEVIKVGASDLHIEVRDKTLIRVRVDGEIRELKEFNGAVLNRETGYEFARTIYNTYSLVSGMSFQENITQDALGLIKNVNGTDVRVRIATAPTEPKGFDMVMRILTVQDSSRPITLEQLGYQEKQRKMIIEAVSQGVGVTIVAGTTGSGKSTTLQNILMAEINSRNGALKVITVEDPPEYFIPGATQIPVVRDKNGDAKKAFESAIKASLRMDPDVIMIGEVRDAQSAELLISAVQTGHKVITTIHAGTALSIIGRLENLGVSRDTLSDSQFISGLVYQKLFAVLCPHCSIPLIDGVVPSKITLDRVIFENGFCDKNVIEKVKRNNPKINIVRALQDAEFINLKDAEAINRIFLNINDQKKNEELLKRIVSVAGDLSQHNIRFKGEGCEFCKGGLKGRTVVSEVVKPDFTLRELIFKGDSLSIYKYWKKNLGGKTAIEDSYDKMLSGVLSPIDIEETFGFIELQTI